MVPFIAKNVWRTPVTGKKNPPPSESSGERDQGKSEEELQLDREAAEAVLRGEWGETLDRAGR